VYTICIYYLYVTVRLRGIGTGISEASKRVGQVSFDVSFVISSQKTHHPKTQIPRCFLFTWYLFRAVVLYYLYMLSVYFVPCSIAHAHADAPPA
jgi:hypothetical protein